jgi:formate hydrogenlyase subunit 3/multisubunit Na+/H+ antiporter MnhD subunit
LPGLRLIKTKSHQSATVEVAAMQIMFVPQAEALALCHRGHSSSPGQWPMARILPDIHYEKHHHAMSLSLPMMVNTTVYGAIGTPTCYREKNSA